MFFSGQDFSKDLERCWHGVEFKPSLKWSEIDEVWSSSGCSIKEAAERCRSSLFLPDKVFQQLASSINLKVVQGFNPTSFAGFFIRSARFQFPTNGPWQNMNPKSKKWGFSVN